MSGINRIQGASQFGPGSRSKGHPAVQQFHANAQAFARKRSDFSKKTDALLRGSYQHYLSAERPSIIELDRVNRSWMNSAAGPTILRTLKMIRQTHASIAKMHARIFG